MQDAVMLDLNVAESKVIKALENPKYVWRTLAGLKRDTGLPTEDINRVLKHMSKDNLMVSRNGKGNRLYSTRQHYRKTQSIAGKFLSVLAGRAL